MKHPEITGAKVNNFIVLPIGDFILSMLALCLGAFMRFGSLTHPDEMFSISTIKLLTFGAVLILSSYMLELYNGEKTRGKKELFLRVYLNICLTLIILALLFYVFPHLFLGRGVLAISLALFSVFQFIWHWGYGTIGYNNFAQNVLILGTGPLAQKIGDIVKHKNHRYILAGHINVPSEQLCLPMMDFPIHGDSFEETVKKENAHKIVVSLSERRGVFPVQDVLACKLNGIEVVDAPTFYEEMTGKLLIENITPSWVIFSEGFRITPFKNIMKRMLDILIGSIGFIILLIAFPFIALAISINSPGPVIYKQVRLGKKGEPFTLYKFRTMDADAEEDKGALWAEKNDPRITGVGKLLRKMRLDEFPQFYNVLKGEMSVVGPRPERPEFIQKLQKIIPYYSERHSLKPGITGWAQIRYPYGSSVQDAVEKLRYDLYYIKHFSIFLDLLIIIETIKVVLFGRGAR
jgi:sugar transferase (PEP-CTERM system associated)